MAFHSLPLEVSTHLQQRGSTSRLIIGQVNEHIATFIDDDKDLCSFTLICPDTHNAVHSHRQSVWRAQFAKRYDLGSGKSGKQVTVSYMIRRMVLKRGAKNGLKNGTTEVEKRCLKILRDLIIGTYPYA